MLHNKRNNSFMVGGSPEMIDNVLKGNRLVPNSAAACNVWDAEKKRPKAVKKDMHKIMERVRACKKKVVFTTPNKSKPSASAPGRNFLPKSRKDIQEK